MITITVKIWTEDDIVRCVADCPSVPCSQQEDELFKEVSEALTGVLKGRAERVGAKMFVFESENQITKEDNENRQN